MTKIALISSVPASQLELNIDSCVENAHESTRDDSCAFSQISDTQEDKLLSFLTRKDSQKRRYGSGWLSTTKAGGTARTDNKYLVYYYRVHWRKRPFAVYIGRSKAKNVLAIGQLVREAIDRDEQPYQIVNIIKAAKKT